MSKLGRDILRRGNAAGIDLSLRSWARERYGIIGPSEPKVDPAVYPRQRSRRLVETSNPRIEPEVSSYRARNLAVWVYIKRQQVRDFGRYLDNLDRKERIR